MQAGGVIQLTNQAHAAHRIRSHENSIRQMPQLYGIDAKASTRLVPKM